MRNKQQEQHRKLQHAKMSSMLRRVVICIRFCWIWSEVSANGEIFETNITLTWDESRKHCESIGKVLFDVKEYGSEMILKEFLADTNQTWVSATVELSHFVKVPVCMKTTSILSDAKQTFDTDIIGNCLKFCKEYLYTGVKGRDCFCFKDSRNLAWSVECNSTCNNHPMHPCGGNITISVYEKADTKITQNMTPGYKECVYARNTRRSTNLSTESCVGYMADGAICERGNDTVCTQNNWTVTEKQICRMDLVSPMRWKQARETCARIGGQLMSSKTSQLNMKENSTYWFGLFRVTMIHKAEALQFDRNDTYCAVARKEGDIVIIEGEDCLKKHSILCQDAIPERRSFFSQHSTEKTIPGQQSNLEPSDGTITYVVVALSAIIVITLVITALVCVFRRRQQKSQHCKEVSTTSSSGDHHALLKRQITNPPAKPSRKANTMKKYLQSSYENVVFVRSEQDVALQQHGQSNLPVEAYDKIYLDKDHIQENDYKEGATHIYDHGSLHMTEDQYDLTVMPGVMTSVLDETYDRTTLKQTLDAANAAREEEGVVESKTGKQIDKDYDTIEGQNSNLSEAIFCPELVAKN